MKALYEAVVTSHGGRDGHITSSDGILDLNVSMPKQLGGKGGATNPEQLFAAGYAACFESAVLHVSRTKKLPVKDTKVVATVQIGPNDSGGFLLAAQLRVTIGGVERAQAQQILEEAHKTCPYSNATRGNIEVKVELAD